MRKLKESTISSLSLLLINEASKVGRATKSNWKLAWIWKVKNFLSLRVDLKWIPDEFRVSKRANLTVFQVLIFNFGRFLCLKNGKMSLESKSRVYKTMKLSFFDIFRSPKCFCIKFWHPFEKISGSKNSIVMP